MKFIYSSIREKFEIEASSIDEAIESLAEEWMIKDAWDDSKGSIFYPATYNE